MFERLVDRVAERAETHAGERTAALADRLADELPPGIGVEKTDGGVRLVGRRLRRRFVLEPALRWMRFR